MLISLFNKNDESLDLYYIFIAFILIVFIFYLVFLFVNNRLNKRVLLTEEKYAVKDIYILEILYGQDKVRVYSKKNHNKVFTYTMDQMLDLIQYNDLEEWKRWIYGIKRGKNLKSSHIVVHIINPVNSKISIARVSLEQANIEQKSIYCNFELIQYEQKNNKIIIPNLINPIEFKNKLLEDIKKKNEPIGTFMIFEFTTIKYITKRYGSSISNECLFEMMRRFEDLIDDDTYISYFGQNSFYIYKKGIIKRNEAISYMKEIYDSIAGESISVNKYDITPSFNVGISILGEYTFEIEELFRNTKSALQGNNKYEKIKYGYYGNINESLTAAYRANAEKLKNFIKNEEFNVFFEPLVSLSSLSIHGYYTRFDYSFNDTNGYLTNLQLAKTIKLKDEFITKVIISMLDQFVESISKRPKKEKKANEKIKLFFKVNIEDLELVKNIILSNQDYLRLRLVIVIDYEQILKEENANIVKKIHEELSLNSFIEIAAVADENMITVYSSVLSICSSIILDEFMLTNIEVDDLKKMNVQNIIDNVALLSGLHYLARGVTKYEQAYTLQKMGIAAISGPYILEPTQDLINNEFLKNRKIQRLHENE